MSRALSCCMLRPGTRCQTWFQDYGDADVLDVTAQERRQPRRAAVSVLGTARAPPSEVIARAVVDRATSMFVSAAAAAEERDIYTTRVRLICDAMPLGHSQGYGYAGTEESLIASSQAIFGPCIP